MQRPPRRRFQQRARLRFHQAIPLQAEAQRAPAHRRVFLHHVIVMMEIGQRLVAAD